MTDRRITPVIDLPQHDNRCIDCGEPATWPFVYCPPCLEARFGKDEE